jgi:hypothetical protein
MSVGAVLKLLHFISCIKLLPYTQFDVQGWQYDEGCLAMKIDILVSARMVRWMGHAARMRKMRNA